MQSGTAIITRSTNIMARAVGVFVTLTASHANHNSTHSCMRRDLRPDLGNVRFTSLYPKLYLPNKHPLLCYGLVCCPDHVNWWRRANVLTCVNITWKALYGWHSWCTPHRLIALSFERNDRSHLKSTVIFPEARLRERNVRWKAAFNQCSALITL